MKKRTRDEHCAFAKLNSAGRCVADCIYNRERNFKRDCTERSGVHHSEVGKEIKLTGRRSV